MWAIPWFLSRRSEARPHHVSRHYHITLLTTHHTHDFWYNYHHITTSPPPSKQPFHALLTTQSWILKWLALTPTLGQCRQDAEILGNLLELSLTPARARVTSSRRLPTLPARGLIQVHLNTTWAQNGTGIGGLTNRLHGIMGRRPDIGPRQDLIP